jgi:hypothetical protein
MRRSSTVRVLSVVLLCGIPVLCATSGCALIYQVVNGDGPKVPAKYSDLKDKRVAVVCVMDSASYDDPVVTDAIADNVGRILKKNIDDIDVVTHEEVSDWKDTNDWDETDFDDIGRGVKADVVLAIVLNDFGVNDNGSRELLRGHADVTVSVYDVKDKGKELFKTTDHGHSFPTSHAISAVSTKWQDFQRTYVRVLSDDIAKYFYDYNMAEDFAKDAAAYAH